MKMDYIAIRHRPISDGTDSVVKTSRKEWQEEGMRLQYIQVNITQTTMMN